MEKGIGVFISLTLAVLISTTTFQPCSANGDEYCDQLGEFFQPELDAIFLATILRKVDLSFGNDSASCLNPTNSSEPPACRTLQYALHESEDTTVGGSASNLRLELGPGVYRSINQTTNVINSYNIAIMGAGVSQTFVVCGRNGTEDEPCNYPNFNIGNSSHVYVSGITFTGCGPITSSLYIGSSNFVFIDECSFENEISPAVLIFDTPNVRILDTSFLHNHPEELEIEVVHNTCYFQRSEDISLFLDNRTTSGGISLYIEESPTKLLIENCSFVNNTARNDSDVGLVRESEKYGQGGALNIRLLNSVGSIVCIRRTNFINNSAEAHAGALAISMSGSTTGSRFIVTGSRFDGNRCLIAKCTGGAVGINFFAGTLSNKVFFLDSNFTANQARSSGALVLSTSVSAENQDGVSDVLRLSNCWFVENRAFFEGTALGVFSITHTNLIGIPVDLYDCHFHDNQASGGSGDTTAVTVYRVLLSLYGNNTFYNNQGGGTSLLSSRMDVRGLVTFERNVAVFGGGMAMSGRSLMLLHNGSDVHFTNNSVREFGAGLYVEYTSSDFILSILNTGCFIRYNSTSVDVPPSRWDARITFKNNTAGIAGAAIYANDMSRCRWLGEFPGSRTIFQLTPEENSPFLFEDNTLAITETAPGNISNETLATGPRTITAKVEYSNAGYGEKIPFSLNSEDEFENFREAVWSVDAPQLQRLGSLSSNNTVFSYQVPAMTQLSDDSDDLVDIINDTANLNIAFSLLQSEASPASQQLSVGGCHPGYQLNQESLTCVCSNERFIVRCNSNNRYFYARDGFWVGVGNDSTPYFTNTIPGFLNCSRLGALPGCLYKFDSPNDQCASGRQGTLCGDCQPNHGVTFDLRFCKSNCGLGGKFLFLFICIITPLLSLAILYFDFPIPNELKGVIFYAQVVGVIYRSNPNLFGSTSGSLPTFFDFLVNMLGFVMPFPVCFHREVPVVLVALIGFVPPLLATVTAVAYGICANRVKRLSHRENYGFHGFYFLFLFVYKYFVDASFIFVSCTKLQGESVFLYQGTQKCRDFPFILLVIFCSLLLVFFGVVLPIYVLKVIYAPEKMIHVRNSLTHGLKNGRRYLWYSVWDIWRRLLFVGANLFISITTPSVVLFIHSMLIMLCLSVLCFVKPYKKYHINVMEGLIILFLFGATLAIYDMENDLYVGMTVASYSILFPFIYGALFILYRILKIIFRKMWPMIEERWQVSKKLKENRFSGKCIELLSKIKEMTKSDPKDTEEPKHDAWHLEVVQPARARNQDSNMMEESYSSSLREALLDDD